VPIVLRFDGLRAVIYPNHHRPAHVHVSGGGNNAVIDLRCPHGPPRVRENYGFKSSELRRIKAALTAELASLCRKWEKIHGYA
jgi:hypothetical protein